MLSLVPTPICFVIGNASIGPIFSGLKIHGGDVSVERLGTVECSVHFDDLLCDQRKPHTSLVVQKMLLKSQDRVKILD